MLRSGRLVDHATMAATVSTDDGGKVLVSNILNSSDAYRRGLRYGDEVLSFADRQVNTTNDFKNILGTLPKDWRVPITYRRAGKTQTTLVRLAGVHTEQQLIQLVTAELGKNAPQPKGKPGEEKPGDEKHGEKKNDAPKAEDLKSAEAKKAEESRPPLPGEPDKALVKSMLAERPGFANYFFNEQTRDAIWKRVQTLGDFSKVDRRWVLTGKIAGEDTPVRIQVDSVGATILLGSRTVEVSYAEAMSDAISKRREGGLLVALRAWQQLMQVGPKQLGETIYLGTAPVYMTTSTVLAEQPLLDVLQSAWYDTSVRFSFPQDSGETRCIEVFR